MDCDWVDSAGPWPGSLSCMASPCQYLIAIDVDEDRAWAGHSGKGAAPMAGGFHPITIHG